MRPKLLRLADWPFWLITAAISAVPLVAVASHLHADTWGERVPYQGWLVSILAAVAALGILAAYYWQRWKFVQSYKYTTTHGIDVFVEEGAKTYLKLDVERETERQLGEWVRYYLGAGENDTTNIASGKYVRGSMCIFRKAGDFTSYTPGWPARRVYGISGWNWAIVGQGGKPIEETAFAHEMNHIHLNHKEGRAVDEQEAHGIFKVAGVK